MEFSPKDAQSVLDRAIESLTQWKLIVETAAELPQATFSSEQFVGTLPEELKRSLTIRKLKRNREWLEVIGKCQEFYSRPFGVREFHAFVEQQPDFPHYETSSLSSTLRRLHRTGVLQRRKGDVGHVYGITV